MPLTPELVAAYNLSCRPFIEAPGPTPAAMLNLKSWRYVLEINSACNLECILCACGNRTGYQYKPGIMDMDLMQKILDKAHSENPGAVVCCYANSEPLLHPRIDECVAHIKMRGFRCELSTNLMLDRKLEKVVAQQPDLFTVSVSGFTQEIYGRHHVGGNIETVKKNLKRLAEIKKNASPSVWFGVSYHMYKDNLGDEMARMKDFAEGLGFQFLISWARVITMEPAIQALRHLEKERTGSVRPYESGPGDLDLNTVLPPADPRFLKNLELLQVHPEKCVNLYARFPVSTVCIIADVFTYIRYDGTVQLCAWTDDRRMMLGNYLDMTQEQISAARRGHPFCKECLRYRTNLYFHIVDCTKWDGGGFP